MATKYKFYSDIDLNFLPQPVSRDVSLRFDDQAVVSSIRNLLLTKPFERLWQPTLSSGIDNILFEPITPLNSSLLQEEIVRVINNYEPRATIATIDVTAYPDQNAYQVSMFFYVGNQTTPTGINLILQRSR